MCWSMSERWDQSDISLTPLAQPSRLDRAAADILGYVAAADILGYVAAPDILGYVAAVLALRPVVSGGVLVETELPAVGLTEETKHHVTLSPAE